MPQLDILLRSRMDGSGFQQVEAQLNKLETDLRKKFSLPDIGKSVLSGLGLGSGFAVAQKFADAIEGHFREAAEYAQWIEQRSRRALEDTRERILLGAKSDEERLKALRLTRAQEQGEVDRINKGLTSEVKYDSRLLGEQSRMVTRLPTADERRQIDEAEESIRRLDRQIRVIEETAKGVAVSNALTDFFQPLEDLSRANAELKKLELGYQQAAIAANGPDIRSIKEITPEDEARAAAVAKKLREELQQEGIRAALQTATDAVEEFDTALKLLDANPALTDREKQAERLRLLGAQAQAIDDQKNALQGLADASTEIDVAGIAAINSTITQLGRKRSDVEGDAFRTRNPDTAINQLRKGNRDLSDPSTHLQGFDEGVEGGFTAWANRVGTMADQLAAGIENTLGTAVSSITSEIMKWDGTGRGALQALGNIGNAIFQSMIQNLIQMGVQWLINTALIKTGMIGIEATGDVLRAGRVVKENAAEAATLPMKTAGAAAAGISSYGVALAFGALAIAMVLGAMGAFADGGFTAPGAKDKPAGIVHAGEWVAPQWMVNHPTFGPLISGLEGARLGVNGFAAGGFVPLIPSVEASVSRPAYEPGAERRTPIRSSAFPSRSQKTTIVAVDSRSVGARLLRERGGRGAVVELGRREQEMRA